MRTLLTNRERTKRMRARPPTASFVSATLIHRRRLIGGLPPRIEFIVMGPPFTFRLHEAWNDITSEVDGAPPPWTFARSHGDGVFQISIAGLYVGGKVPNPSSRDLMRLLLSSVIAQEHDTAVELLTEEGRLCIAAATFHSLEWQIRLWYFSDGYSVGQASLITSSPARPADLAACESMVRSIEMATSGRARLK